MSDRHIVQKNFICRLEDYHTSVLPEAISSWNDLSVEEQSSYHLSITSFVGFIC